MKRYVDIKKDHYLRISQHAPDANENRKGMSLTLSLASFLWDIGKQYSPRCDAAERGVPGAILLA